MEPVSLTQLILALLGRAIYLVISSVVEAMRNISWALNGTYSQIKKNGKPENYHHSAHVMKVIYTHRFDMASHIELKDFVLTHERFVSPEYVFRDGVHLIQVTDQEAIFVEKQPGSMPLEEFSFEIFGVFHAPKNIITMPLHSLNRLAESMPKARFNNAKLVFIHNQARCGGTLLNAVFKSTGRCTTFCEPHAINAVCKYHHMELMWNRDFACRIMKSIITLMCKPRHDSAGEEVLAYVFKPVGYSTICADVIEEAFPEAVQIFMYRDPVKSAFSLERSSLMLPNGRLVKALIWIPGITARWVGWRGYCSVDYRGWTPRSDSPVPLQKFRIIVSSIMRYVMYQKRGVRFHGVHYDMLIRNQEAMTAKIFQLCGLPVGLVPKAIEAFKRDSQNDAPFSWSRMKKSAADRNQLTPEAQKEAEEICRTLNLPPLDSWTNDDFHLPGTITL